MSFSLPPDLMRLVRRKVEIQRYPSPDAVVREALLLLEERDRLREERLHDLKRELAIGVSQANQGQVERLDEETPGRIAGEASTALRSTSDRLLPPVRVFATVQARQDLDVAQADVRDERFLARVLDGCLGREGPPAEEMCLDHLYPGLRCFTVSRYHIYYLEEAGRPVVIRVLHLAWDIGNIVRRITTTGEG